MVKEHIVEQRSQEWFKLRCGKITGSRFKEIMPAEKARTKWTKGQLSLLREIAAERLTGIWEESYPSKAMQWGIEKEDEARQVYADYCMEEIRESGFWEFSDYAGCSPDGIMNGSKKALEIKCPASKTHMLYSLDSDELDKEYHWQAVGHALGTGLGICDLISYDPRFPDGKQLVIVHLDGIEKDMALLKERLEEAEDDIKGMIT